MPWLPQMARIITDKDWGGDGGMFFTMFERLSLFHGTFPAMPVTFSYIPEISLLECCSGISLEKIQIEKIMKINLVAAFVMLGSIAGIFAADVAGSKDHPLMKRIDGSEIIWSKDSAFDEMIVPLERIQFDYDKQDFKDTKREKIEGKRSICYYKVSADVSTLEAVRQYEGDLKEKGFAVLFSGENEELDDGYNRFVTRVFPVEAKTEQLEGLHNFNKEEQRYSVLKGKGEAGNDIYVSVFALKLVDITVGLDKLVEGHGLEKGQTVVRVDVLETKAMEARMKVVKAEEITKAIDTAGRIAIYGVYFDTDKAVIKPESAESIAEMARAVKEGGGRYLIVGHTDNAGDYAHNQVLSLSRAKAVTAALTANYGISADTVIPVGVGMAAPVSSNADDAGRAKNRRVEIVKM